MGVGLLRLEIQRSCQGRQKASVLAKERRFEAQNAPESQTLIVLSRDPDTIILPSGEKATDVTMLLWAFDFSPDGDKIVSGGVSGTIKVWDSGAFWAPNRLSCSETDARLLVWQLRWISRLRR